MVAGLSYGSDIKTGFVYAINKYRCVGKAPETDIIAVMDGKSRVMGVTGEADGGFEPLEVRQVMLVVEQILKFMGLVCRSVNKSASVTRGDQGEVFKKFDIFRGKLFDGQVDTGQDMVGNPDALNGNIYAGTNHVIVVSFYDDRAMGANPCEAFGRSCPVSNDVSQTDNFIDPHGLDVGENGNKCVDIAVNV